MALPMTAKPLGGPQGGFGAVSGVYGTGSPSFNYDPQEAEEFNKSLDWQRQAAGLQSQTQLAQGQMAAQASELPAQLKQQRFNTVWPFVSGQFANASQNAAGAGAAGGGAGGGPRINVGPVWSNPQIQQQQNAQRAQTDAATQSNIRQSQQKMAGQGYGTNSPLSQALAANFANQGMATNAANTQQINWNAAQGNQQAMLASQQAESQLYAQRQQEAIQRQQIAASTQNALLAALGGMA